MVHFTKADDVTLKYEVCPWQDLVGDLLAKRCHL